MNTHRVRILVMMVLCLAAARALSAKEEFTILALRGDASHKPAEKAEWVRLKVGQPLFKGALVRLADDAYVGLMHATGATIELKSKGVYEVSMLALKCVPNKTLPLTGKVLNFILSEINEDNNEAPAAGISGAVERAASPAGSIDVGLPPRMKLMGSEVCFSWFPAESVPTYDFRISDRYARDVYTAAVTDTSLRVNLDGAGIKRGESYFWSVAAQRDNSIRSAENMFIWQTEEMTRHLRDSVKQISAEIGEDTSATATVILASFYAGHELFQDAMALYEKALRQAPEVDEYRKLVAAFLVKQGLSMQARRLWKK